MDKSNDINELAAALSKAQSKFLPIFKSLKVSYATSAGKKEYNYAPLSAVIDATKQALSDNGLAIIQPTEIKDNKLYINTVLCHSSGQWIESSMYVGESGQPPQAEGSALSYKRRYGLSAMLNIASEEDDDAQEE